MDVYKDSHANSESRLVHIGMFSPYDRINHVFVHIPYKGASNTTLVTLDEIYFKDKHNPGILRLCDYKISHNECRPLVIKALKIYNEEIQLLIAYQNRDPLDGAHHAMNNFITDWLSVHETTVI